MTSLPRTLLSTLAASALLSRWVTGAAGEEFDAENILAGLRHARAQWRAQGPPSYNYLFERKCFCVEDVQGPFAIVVREGKVSEARFTDNADLEGRDISDDLLEDLPTMEGLFDLIETEATRKIAPAALDIKYDKKYGYPAQVHVDHIAEVRDDDITYRVLRFHSAGEI